MDTADPIQRAPVLEISGLTVALPKSGDRTNAVEDISLTVGPGEIVCVVGESGSGKSVTAQAVMGLLPKGQLTRTAGSIKLEGQELTTKTPAQIRDLRGARMSMIFQEPMTALNPVEKVGAQIGEVLEIHSDFGASERRERILDVMRAVHLPDVEQMIDAYSHQLSGGQRQRVMIAAALVLDPVLLIADEPTTALDVTTQAQILLLIAELRERRGTGVLFITHDFGVVAEIAHRVVVMQHGRIVEVGTRDEIIKAPREEYTKTLISSVPSLTPPGRQPKTGEIKLETKALSKTYGGAGFLFRTGRTVHAARDVNVHVRRGETLGIVGESGSGKTTVARCIARLIAPSEGEILIDGDDWAGLSGYVRDRHVRRGGAGRSGSVRASADRAGICAHQGVRRRPSRRDARGASRRQALRRCAGAAWCHAGGRRHPVADCVTTPGARRSRQRDKAGSEIDMTMGMVSAPQPEAVEAGLDVLKTGGNVVDAAIVAALVQTVVDPQMCGIAGFGSMHVCLLAEGVHTLIDFHGRAPGAVKPDMWQDLIVRECDDGFGFVLKEEVNEIGYQSMTTPMTIKAFEEALARFGTRSLGKLIQPAIAYAEEGFQVRPNVAQFWNRGAENGRIARRRGLTEYPATAKVYTKPDGSLYEVGEVLRNPDMARTYRRIADYGAEDFYTGEIAAAIAADLAANGGLITLEDLRECATVSSEPLWTTYRGHRVATNPLPGGGLMIVLMLNILDNFDLAAMGQNSPDYIATVSEVMKIATVDKDTRMGDPAFFDVPLEELMSKDYAARTAERIRKGEMTYVPRMNAGGVESRETTHICVADSNGNAVTMTHSLGSSSGVVTDGLGFMYNNCMMVFDPRPGHAGSLAPGKARFSAISPTIVFRDDKPFFLVGSPGGTTITMGNLQAILNAVDFGMTAEQAVIAPRFTTTSNTIEVTNRILRATERDLQARGYPTKRHAQSYMNPIVQAIRIADGKLDGGADPSGDGMAAKVEMPG